MPVPRNRKLVLLFSFLVGVLAGGLALVFTPPARHEVGPSVLTAKASPGSAHTVLAFPPLGTVRAGTHPVPVTLEVALTELDVTALQDIIRSAERRSEVTDEVERDLRDMARSLALRSTLVALIAGAVAGAVLPWRRTLDVVAGAAGGLIAAIAVVGSVALSFDIAGFEEPRYSGALTRAPGVLETLQRTELALSDVDSRFETAAQRLSELLELASTPQTNPREDTVAILHVSDIHSNPLGITLTRQLASRFQVDAVIDSGDLTSFGEAIEADVASEIANLDVPYIFVPGNHDSAANQARIDRIDNVELLDDGTIDVEDVRILGWRDPTYTVWDNVSTEDANELRTTEGEEVAEALSQESGVDVLVVHDRRMGVASEGLVPLALSGHTHERDTTEDEETDYLTVGSTGATGLSFFVEASRPYEAEIVYFREGELAAVDYITFEALGDEFEIDRERLDD